MLEFEEIEGQFKGDIVLFALSTCPLCNKVKRLLDGMGVAYSFVDVDMLSRLDREAAKAEMRRWDPKRPFPMLVINDSRCVIGYDPERIRKEIENGPEQPDPGRGEPAL